MIKIQIENNARSAVITLNDDGIDELINILTFIKSTREHYHLLAGNELVADHENEDSIIQHVKIEVV
jgi:hypothetical protein